MSGSLVPKLFQKSDRKNAGTIVVVSLISGATDSFAILIGGAENDLASSGIGDSVRSFV